MSGCSNGRGGCCCNGQMRSSWTKTKGRPSNVCWYLNSRATCVVHVCMYVFARSSIEIIRFRWTASDNCDARRGGGGGRRRRPGGGFSYIIYISACERALRNRFMYAHAFPELYAFVMSAAHINTQIRVWSIDTLMYAILLVLQRVAKSSYRNQFHHSHYKIEIIETHNIDQNTHTHTRHRKRKSPSVKLN